MSACARVSSSNARATTPGAEWSDSGAPGPDNAARESDVSAVARYVAANEAPVSSASSRATSSAVPPPLTDRAIACASRASGSLAPAMARSSSQSGAPFMQYASAPASIIAITSSASSEPA